MRIGAFLFQNQSQAHVGVSLYCLPMPYEHLKGSADHMSVQALLRNPRWHQCLTSGCPSRFGKPGRASVHVSAQRLPGCTSQHITYVLRPLHIVPMCLSRCRHNHSSPDAQACSVSFLAQARDRHQGQCARCATVPSTLQRLSYPCHFSQKIDIGRQGIAIASAFC